MLSFLSSSTPRTNTSTFKTLTFDNGASTAYFKHHAALTPDTGVQAVVAVNRLPPCLPADDQLINPPTSPIGPGTPNSSLAPPLHYHHSQDESFVVRKGQAVFYTYHLPSPGLFAGLKPLSWYQCKAEVVGPEQSVFIPKGVVHTFRNASSEDEMELEFVLSPNLSGSGNSDLTVEETFFRNTWSYRADCTRSGTPRSLLQVMCFNRRGGVVLMIPGYGTWISWALGAAGAFVGRWIWGVRSAYAEYA